MVSTTIKLPSTEPIWALRRAWMRAQLRWLQMRALGWGLLILFASGCAGHSAKTLEARAALDGNSPALARKLLNQELKVKGPDEIPAKLRKGDELLILDRSMISTQLEEYAAASNDLQFSDKQIEMLDMSRTALDDVGKYVFSDSTGPYLAPPYEKLMINTMNIVNYLARGDLNGARIEARRLSIMQKYLRDTDHPSAAMNAPGGYLAGFVFERSGRPDIALRYYDEALSYTDFSSLAEPIARLSQKTAYTTPRLRELLDKYGHAPAVGSASPSPRPATASTAGHDTTSEDGADGGQIPASNGEAAQSPDEPGDLLIIINYGRVPSKVAKRIPIGLALTYGTLFMSPSHSATANRLAAQGLVTWVNYPELEEKTRALVAPTVQVDGEPLTLEGAAAVDLLTRKAYEDTRGRVIASAITRLITRVVAGEAAGAAARGASGEGLLGALVSIGTQAALTAADTPDTRSWSTLPARMAVGRMRVPPGKHRVTLEAQGERKTTDIEMRPGGWHAIVLTVLR